MPTEAILALGGLVLVLLVRAVVRSLWRRRVLRRKSEEASRG